MLDSRSSSVDLLVACLCAQWCNVCGDYQVLFDQQASEFAALASFQWVDIEDHEQVLEAVEVEDFPTLLIACGDQPVFFGAVKPHAGTLARLVRSALDFGLNPIADTSLEGLSRRVRRLGET